MLNRSDIDVNDSCKKTYPPWFYDKNPALLILLIAYDRGRWKIALVERKNEHFSGGLSFPSGFIQSTSSMVMEGPESFKYAAQCEFLEKIELSVPLKFISLGVYDNPAHNLYGVESQSVSSHVFAALLTENQTLTSENNPAAFQWDYLELLLKASSPLLPYHRESIRDVVERISLLATATQPNPLISGRGIRQGIEAGLFRPLMAAKNRPVFARQAMDQETVTTYIENPNGTLWEETTKRSNPKDWILTSSIEGRKNQYIISGKKFQSSYRKQNNIPESPDGFTYLPIFRIKTFYRVPPSFPEFRLETSWGTPMQVFPGAVLIENGNSPDGEPLFYAVNPKEFEATYSIFNLFWDGNTLFF